MELDLKLWSDNSGQRFSGIIHTSKREILTFISKCSVTPRPLFPNTPKETLSSMKSLNLCCFLTRIRSGNGQIWPVFVYIPSTSKNFRVLDIASLL